MGRIYVDIETYCPVDLKKAGVYAYAEHPEFNILMLAWAVEDDPVQWTGDPDEIARLAETMRNGDHELVAFNAQFERICLYGPGSDTARWRDPMVLAGEYGLPMKLGDLAKALGCSAKDTAGTRLINTFSKPNRKGERTTAADEPEKWEKFGEYCATDVEVLREVDRLLDDFPTATERELWLLDQTINDRGIVIDLDMARAAVSAAALNREIHMERAREITGAANPNSTHQLKAWFADAGVALPNMQAETVEDLLSGTDDVELTDDQREVLRIRQDLALSSSAKFAAAVNGVSNDGRLRGQFRFFGAHTGRWSGRGVQLQNLPRDSAENEAAEIVDLKLGNGTDDDTLKRLVRPLLVGPFTVVDFSAIEARVLAWLAGERWVIEAFEKGRDIYVETAERMGGLTRQQGKVAVLALGYGGGINALTAMNRGPMENSQFLVNSYRGTVPMICRFWSDLDDAVDDGGRAGRIGVQRKGSDVHALLPSGRPLVYRRMKRERFVIVEKKTNKRVHKYGPRFEGRRGRTATWGGSLTENVVQAVARDVLGEALLALEAAGYRVVGHVHDEVLIEGVHDPAEIAEIMCRVPSWAEGLPLGAEGHVCERYTKG